MTRFPVLRFPVLCFVALSVLLLPVVPAASAKAPKVPERLGRLVPGEYRVASIEAWEAADRGRSMLGAPDWERVEVRAEAKKQVLVIYYKGGRTRAVALRPSGPPPTSWHANEFIVSASALPDGGVRLSMHFCYRGFVHLTLQAKSASPDTTP